MDPDRELALQAWAYACARTRNGRTMHMHGHDREQPHARCTLERLQLLATKQTRCGEK